MLTKLETMYIEAAVERHRLQQKQPVGTGPVHLRRMGLRPEHHRGQEPETTGRPARPYIDSVIFRPIVEPLDPGGRSAERQRRPAQCPWPLKDVGTLQEGFQRPGLVRGRRSYARPTSASNMTRAPFKDNPNLRKAIAWAVDRQTIRRPIAVRASANRPRFPCQRTNWAYTTELNNPAGYDLAKAKAFYDQASPKPTLRHGQSQPDPIPDEVKMAELMQQSLAPDRASTSRSNNSNGRPGIKDVVEQRRLRNGDRADFRAGSIRTIFYYQWLHTGESVQHRSKYSDPQMDQLMDQARKYARSTLNGKVLYTQIANKMLDDVPWSHIIYRQSVMARKALRSRTLS